MDDKKLPRNNAGTETPEKEELNSEDLEQVAGGVYTLPGFVPDPTEMP